MRLLRPTLFVDPFYETFESQKSLTRGSLLNSANDNDKI